MRRHRETLHGEKSLKFIAEAQNRIRQQQQTIVRLKDGGHPTEQAEYILLGLQQTLHQLQNHRDVIQELSKPFVYIGSLGKRLQ